MNTNSHEYIRTILLTPTGWLQARVDDDLNSEATEPISKCFAFLKLVFEVCLHVQRNIERFPDDFMFQLSEGEVDFMVSQNAIPSRKHLGGSLPYVFTEQGVTSLSGVLKSAKSAEIHVRIMRAFVEMRKFIQHNANIFARLDSVERRQIAFESETDRNFEKIFQAFEAGEPPKQGIFYDGQIYDACSFVASLIRKAKKSLILIDNYIDDSVLTLLSKRNNGVSVTIYTKAISKQLALDLKN